MFHYVYQVTNLVNGKIYVGKHSTQNLDDGYMGSGKLLNLAIKKHGVENFRKHIVKMCETSEEAFKFEHQIVNEQFVADENSYNLKPGGRGGSDWSHINDDVESRKEKNRRAAAAMNETLSTDVEFQKRKSLRMSAQNKHLFQTGKLKSVDWTGRRHSEESKAKIGCANAKSQLGSRNSQFGSTWIHNPTLMISKKIRQHDIQDHLDQGWLKGRKMYQNNAALV